jgi:ABC-2 type transport system ATP-binding protein
MREGLSILLTTPYLDEAERCSRVGLLDRGHLLTVDTPDALREGEPGVLVEIVAEPRRRAAEALRERDDVGDVDVFGQRLHVRLPGTVAERGEERAEELAGLLRQAGITVHTSRPSTPTLEDVFISRIRAREDRSGTAEVSP